MDKINPLLYITDVDPVPEAILNASGWFETEYMEMTYDSFLDGGTNYLEWYMAQGWTVYDKLTWYDAHGGTFVSGGGYAVTKYSMKRRKLQAERVLQSMITEFTDAYNEGRQVNDSRYDELVTLYSVMLDKTENDLANLATTVDGYTDIIDAIIKGLPADFDAHKVDVDAILATWSTAIDTAITSSDGIITEYVAVLAPLIAALPTNYTAHKTDVDGLLDDWGASMRADINTRFNNELTKAMQALTDRGMYNSTVWTSTSAGIETERSKALVDLEDKIAEKQVALKDRLYEQQVSSMKFIFDAQAQQVGIRQNGVFKAIDLRNLFYGRQLDTKDRLIALKMSMNTHILEANHRLLATLQDGTYKPLDFRNAILSAMFNFMERRTDDYPGLDGLAGIAAQLGFSEGAAVVAPPS
jgi:hypothetical protein